MKKNNSNETLEEEASQPVHIINKPLKLETVHEGSTEDDLLVRGPDNTVKYVPQSELVINSTLSQVLSAGNEDYSGTGIYLFDPSDSKNVSFQNYGNFGVQGSTNYTSMFQDGIGFRNMIGSGEYYTNSYLKGIQTTDPTKLNIFRFPNKVNGEYTLATTTDIPNSQGINDVLNISPNALDKQINLSTSVNSNKTYLSPNFLVMETNGFSASILSTAYTNNGTNVRTNGSLNLNGKLDSNPEIVNTIIPTVEAGSANTIYKLPYNDVNGKTVTLATISDIITYSPVSGTTTGVVDNTPLQELGGVDKTINGIKIGKGNGTTTENILLGSANTFNLNTTGDYNTAVGYDSMIANTTGNNNSAFGEWALRSNTTGSSNTAVGVNALNANTSGTYNVAIGTLALNTNKTASYNVAMGASALSKTIDGNNNVAIGASALRNNVSGNNNVAIGTSAMFNTIGNLNSNLDGCLCTAVGMAALYSNTTGNAIAVGANSLYNNTTGTYNIGIGDQAGSGITTGSGNTIIAGTGFILRGGGITTGSNNMILAPNSGNTTGITTGSGNVVVGKVTGLLATASNTITISDGVGNIAITKGTTGELKTPNLTQALIISGGASSLVNKGYVDNTGAVDNATTTSLSSATLTTTYPNALSGFRVRCLNITGGALTYEKTASSWIQYAISITQ